MRFGMIKDFYKHTLVHIILNKNNHFFSNGIKPIQILYTVGHPIIFKVVSFSVIWYVFFTYSFSTST